MQVLNFVYSSKPTLTWGSFAIKLPYLKVTGLSLSKPQKVKFQKKIPSATVMIIPQKF